LESDGAPTQGVREVYAEQSAELHKLEKEFEALVGNELAGLNQESKKIDLPGVLVPHAK